MLRNRTIHYRPDRARPLAATAIAPGQIPLTHKLPLKAEQRRKRAFRKRTSFSCASTSVVRLPDVEPPCRSADHRRGCISAMRSFETPLHASAEKYFPRPRSVSHVPCRARANATIHVAALPTRPALVQPPPTVHDYRESALATQANLGPTTDWPQRTSMPTTRNTGSSSCHPFSFANAASLFDQLLLWLLRIRPTAASRAVSRGRVPRPASASG